MASGTGSPCGACKFLRRKCAAGCVFAPHFSSEQGPARFAAVHRVFGASNASKLLLHVSPADRGEAAVTMVYEAQARVRDPVYGCVAHIFALQQQVVSLQVQLMQAKAQLAHPVAINSSPVENQEQWQDHVSSPPPQSYDSYPHGHHFSPQSCLDYMDHNSDSHPTEGVPLKDGIALRPCLKKRGHQYCDTGELQDLALRMIRS